MYHGSRSATARLVAERFACILTTVWGREESLYASLNPIHAELYRGSSDLDTTNTPRTLSSEITSCPWKGGANGEVAPGHPSNLYTKVDIQSKD